MDINVTVGEELYRSFSAARMIAGEDEDQAIVTAISSYTREMLMRGATAIPAATATASASAPNPQQAEGNLKQEFLAWFKRQKTPGRNTPYNPVTISGYSGRIQNTCQEPGFEAVGAGNLFEIDDPDELASVVERMRACPAYAEHDARTHNGLTAALKKYAEFLRARASDSVVAPMQCSEPEKVEARREAPAAQRRQVPGIDDPELAGILTARNKVFVSKCLRLLEECSTTPEEDIEVLTDMRKCKEQTGHDIPILKPTVSVGKASRDERMHKNYERYYADVFVLWGRRFIVSKEWYGLGGVNPTDNRTPFFNWVIAHGK